MNQQPQIMVCDGIAFTHQLGECTSYQHDLNDNFKQKPGWGPLVITFSKINK